MEHKQVGAGFEACGLIKTDYTFTHSLNTKVRDKMADERRHYQRVDFDAEVLMEHGDASWVCHLIDISLKGLLVIFPDGVDAKKDEVYQMEFRLGADAAIHMHVKVKHMQDHLVGLEWNDIDLESLTHLRRLLELNLPNPDEMHREISELG